MRGEQVLKDCRLSYPLPTGRPPLQQPSSACPPPPPPRHPHLGLGRARYDPRQLHQLHNAVARQVAHRPGPKAL